jgi:hypothetical protein
MIESDLKFFENLMGKENMEKGFGRDYNIFCCEQGIEIAKALETKEKIIEFSKMNYEDQKSLVKGLSSDHSGNTFGMSCRLAIAYIPELLVNKRDRKINEIIE